MAIPRPMLVISEISILPSEKYHSRRNALPIFPIFAFPAPIIRRFESHIDSQVPDEAWWQDGRVE